MINTTHSYKNPLLEGEKPGCTRSKTGFCIDCPMYITMPVNVEDPVSGNIIQAGTVQQCVDIWTLMGTWDGGRQTLRLHAGVNQAQNEANRRQEQVFGALVHFALPTNTEKRLEHATDQDLQAG